MGDPRYRAKDAPRLLQRNADGFFEAPGQAQSDASSRGMPVRSATSTGVPAASRTRSKSRGKPSPSGSQGPSLYQSGGSTGSSPAQSRRPSDDSYSERERYRRPSNDGTNGAEYDRNARRPSGGESSSSRTSPLSSRRPSVTEHPSRGGSLLRSTSGLSDTPQRGATTNSPPTRSRENSTSNVSSRVRETVRDSERERPSDRVRERDTARESESSRSRLRDDPVTQRTVDRNQEPPVRLRAATRTEAQAPSAQSTAGPQSASFEDMLKALEDLHVKTAANPPRSTPSSPAERVPGRADTGRSSKEYDRMTASLNQLLSTDSPVESAASSNRDSERRERERDTDRNQDRARERIRERAEAPRTVAPTRERSDRAKNLEIAREKAREDARHQRDGTSRPSAVTEPNVEAKVPEPESPTNELNEKLDARDTQRRREEQERIQQETNEANRAELAMIAAARQRESPADRQREQSRAMEREVRADESLIVPDYVEGLMMTLRADRDAYPVPDDFQTPDGYGVWEDTIRAPFSEVLCELLQARFINRRKEAPRRERSREFSPVKLDFKIVEARGLVAKEGRTRDPYCTIEHGHIPDDGTEEARKADKERKDRQVLQTETVKGTTNPHWDEKCTLTANSLSDKVMVTVYDRLKDQFLGRVKITFGDVIPAAAQRGSLREWYKLNGVGKKEKDRYVGGEMLIEVIIRDGGSAFGPASSTSRAPQDPLAALESAISATNVDLRALYKVLLRACLILDMNMLGNAINERTEELLSDESASLLLIIGRTWGLSEAFMSMSNLELLFERYKRYEIPQGALLRAYEMVRTDLKKPGWLSPYEKPALVNLLGEMDEYYRTQISKYKEFFPKNTPKDALETTVMMLRMICRVSVYREARPNLAESFRDELRTMLTEAAIARYQKLSELSQPLDDSDVEGVIEGVLKLAELVSEEIEADAKWFKAPFAKELDIVRLTAETYLKYFVLTLESNTEHIASDTAVHSASKSVFDLYRRVKVMGERYAVKVPGLKRMSVNAGFNVERWFSPFISRWLDHLSARTVVWVNNAVKADAFKPIADTGEERGANFSSSVTDLFSAVYQELEFIKGLEWSDPIQSAGFMQAFAKSVSKAIDHYCDAIALGEIKADSTGTSWQGLLATATASVGKSSQSAPTDIANESCVKLCNIEYAMSKLDDMYRVMNVSELNRVLRRHRTAMAQDNLARPSSNPRTPEDDTYVKGAFQIHLSYAENLKPCNKNGLANPYIIVRVPDGTVVPALEEAPASRILSMTGATVSIPSARSSTGSSSAGPTILNGLQCELARSRVVRDTINPTWDETFEVILPPVTKIEVAVLSKNLLAGDEFAGKAIVDLSQGTRLRRKLNDHLTHDVYVEMEPQGRVLVRFTMEGGDEDVDFWFRRSKERLGRMRDDFVRALTARIIPYAREEIIRVIKSHEAVPVPSKSFFSSLTTAVQYSNVTATGASIDDSLSDGDADVALDPLIEYLNKNLGTLDVYLSERMSQEVIRRCWDEIVAVVEWTLVPPLYGPIERDRRILNRRQSSMASATLRLLKDFFHADGNGVTNRLLETRKFTQVSALVDAEYHTDVPRLRREYEKELLRGRDREHVLRLVRVKIEKDEAHGFTNAQLEEARQWIDAQLTRRKELVKR
ncbi:hypothetical protein HKX48_006394 [Thoreauomyces humboldtii]|nr:hypothetical protein HKX48_006394 [Thoreauomyces humboldtii]